MVKFEGKYELKNNEKYVEYLLSVGSELTPEIAEKMAESSVLTVTKEGNKFTLEEQSQIASTVKTFTIGEPFEEELLKTIKAKTIATLDGNKLALETKVGDGRSGKYVFEFSNDGVTIILSSPHSSIIGKRYYKRT